MIMKYEYQGRKKLKNSPLLCVELKEDGYVNLFSLQNILLGVITLLQ